MITRMSTPAGNQTGRHKWDHQKPVLPKSRNRSPTGNVYRPFASGGIVLCRHNPQAEGLSQFSSVSLLPSGWETGIRSLTAAEE